MSVSSYKSYRRDCDCIFLYCCRGVAKEQHAVTTKGEIGDAGAKLNYISIQCSYPECEMLPETVLKDYNSVCLAWRLNSNIIASVTRGYLYREIFLWHNRWSFMTCSKHCLVETFLDLCRFSQMYFIDKYNNISRLMYLWKSLQNIPSVF